MFFRLEGLKETFSNKAGEVFVDVGKKPSFVTSRAGRKSVSQAKPVKVTLTGNDSVHQILRQARQLNLS